ncbi:MAG: hypothetical protein AAB847_02235 [Patescibacteria group bacterium]
MPKKKTTIDDLAGMVQKGFLEIKDEMKSEFVEVHKEIEGLRLEVEARFESIEKRLDRIEYKILDDFNERLARVEVRLFNDKGKL